MYVFVFVFLSNPSLVFNKHIEHLLFMKEFVFDVSRIQSGMYTLKLKVKSVDKQPWHHLGAYQKNV